MMGAALAAGVPTWPSIGGGFDLSPLVMIAVAILGARFLFRMELTGAVVGGLVLGGVFTSWLADVTGALPAIGIGLLVLTAGSAWVRRAQAR
jgi:hypothetical protein